MLACISWVKEIVKATSRLDSFTKFFRIGSWYPKDDAYFFLVVRSKGPRSGVKNRKNGKSPSPPSVFFS